MSDCKWQVGKTYNTTLAGVTATITKIDDDGVWGHGSRDFFSYPWHWSAETGRVVVNPNNTRTPHLTAELADEPQVSKSEQIRRAAADALEKASGNPMVRIVDHPPHCTHGSVECIDAIEAALSTDEFRGYLRGNVLKYVWRCEHKGGIEDLRKADWYLKRLIEKEGGEE